MTFWQNGKRFQENRPGLNPFDPDTDPQEYTKWEFDHQGDVTQVANSDDFNTKRLALILATMAAPVSAGGGGAEGVGGWATGSAPVVANGTSVADLVGEGVGDGIGGLSPGVGEAGFVGPVAGGAAPTGFLADGTPVFAGAATGSGATAGTGVTLAGGIGAPTATAVSATTGNEDSSDDVSSEVSSGGGDLASNATNAAVPGSSSYKLLKDVLKGAGAAIGGADAAAANNRGIANDYGLATWKAGNDYNLSAARLALDNNDLGLRGFDANVTAKSDLENELMKRAQVEGDQRATDLKNLYKDSYAQHPSVSKFNTQGVPALSDQYRAALTNLANQGSTELSKPRTYNASTLPAPTMPTYTQPGFTVPTMTPAPPMQRPSTLEQAGNWLAPTLATASGFFNSSDPANSDASMARRIAQYLQEQS